MYVRNDIYPRCLRIFDQNKDEELSGAEIIQIQLDTIPATSIYGLYMETGKLKDEKEHAHKMLQKRVDNCIKKGHNVIMMGDYNTPLNDRTNQPKNVATDRLLE